ncbi:hypothetical protein D3C73_1598340 [compost metagenome]
MAQLVVTTSPAVGGAIEGFCDTCGVEGVADVVTGESALGQTDDGDAVHRVIGVTRHPAKRIGD